MTNENIEAKSIAQTIVNNLSPDGDYAKYPLIKDSAIHLVAQAYLDLLKQQEGTVLPLEPTEEMIDKAYLCDEALMADIDRAEIIAIYKAMIKA